MQPTVNGKYVVITDNMKSQEQLLSIADYLVERARKDGVSAAAKKKQIAQKSRESVRRI